ncbi:uncharacterized protein LOC136075466 [Hydra vulgaris]|uniref:Uncharacterized protein LOC136075466 n=1 Tax=Hydra vulgaris TaxID=6087 RepID=A0ABM4B7I5_HYDVU
MGGSKKNLFVLPGGERLTGRTQCVASSVGANIITSVAPATTVASGSTLNNVDNNEERVSGRSITASSSSCENESLTFEEYKRHCSQHPGPLSERSFNKWQSNGGMDEPSFKWRAHPYRGVGRQKKKQQPKG